MKSHYTIVIHNNHIEEVGPVNRYLSPDYVYCFYYPGKYVIPGLIDSHVHLATDPSDEDNRRRAEKDLKDMLSGITSVDGPRRCGKLLASLSRDAGLRQIISPDIYYAALMAGPAFFKNPTLTAHSEIAGDMPI